MKYLYDIVISFSYMINYEVKPSFLKMLHEFAVIIVARVVVGALASHKLQGAGRRRVLRGSDPGKP